MSTNDELKTLGKSVKSEVASKGEKLAVLEHACKVLESYLEPRKEGTTPPDPKTWANFCDEFSADVVQLISTISKFPDLEVTAPLILLSAEGRWSASCGAM
jgi:hypothetical protein